jgi:hypothetical protein
MFSYRSVRYGTLSNTISISVSDMNAPKVALIPQDAMANKLGSTPFSAQDARALLRNEVWNELDSRNAQPSSLTHLLGSIAPFPSAQVTSQAFSI